MPSPCPTAATRPALPKTTRSVPVSACEGVAVAFQRNNVSTAHRIEDREYLIMNHRLLKLLSEHQAGSARSWVPPISFEIKLSDFPLAKRLNSSFSRGLNITTGSRASSGGEAAFPFARKCRSVPIVQCLTLKDRDRTSDARKGRLRRMPKPGRRA